MSKETSPSLDIFPDAVMIINSHAIIEYVNTQAAKLFGYHQNELISQPIATVLPSNPRWQQRKITTGITVSGQHKEGHLFPIEISLSPYETTKGLFTLVVARDMSSHKTAELQLEMTINNLKRSNQELEHFFYIASHDLREPLRMIISYTQLIAERYQDKLDSNAREFIAFAVEGASRMEELLNDLLTYSRIGSKPEKPADINLNQILDNVLLTIHQEMIDRSAEIVHDSLPIVQGYAAQISLVFLHLISNAIKFCEKKPKIHIGVKEEADKWVFSIQDNGIGIDPAYFERIFVIFQHLHPHDQYPGTGIGLAIAKKVILRHQGDIWVESQPGKGSTFYFSLPKT